MLRGGIADISARDCAIAEWESSDMLVLQETNTNTITTTPEAIPAGWVCAKGKKKPLGRGAGKLQRSEFLTLQTERMPSN